MINNLTSRAKNLNKPRNTKEKIPMSVIQEISDSAIPEETEEVSIQVDENDYEYVVDSKGDYEYDYYV